MFDNQVAHEQCFGCGDRQCERVMASGLVKILCRMNSSKEI